VQAIQVNYDIAELALEDRQGVTEARGYLEVLPEITRRIPAVSDPEKVILSGSYARGDFPGFWLSWMEWIPLVRKASTCA
jgi:hypothetical protein